MEINNKSIRRSLRSVGVDLAKANSKKRSQTKYSEVSRKLH
jgi:hypothetical protein